MKSDVAFSDPFISIAPLAVASLPDTSGLECFGKIGKGKLGLRWKLYMSK